MKQMIIGCLILLTVLNLITSSPSEDLVTNLPKYGYSKSKIYSGYLNTNDVFGGKRLHYFYLESQNSPTNDPLVLWLNGGPGCSSLDGLVTEHGPRIFKPKTTELYDNEYSWNNAANIIYLESPAGVGFSKGIHEFLSDEQVASDNLSAVLKFFEKFPELLSKEFYITGESYAGVYIPHLASKILDNNASKSTKVKINLKGIMVGNGLTDPNLDITNATVDYAYEHGLYSIEERKKFIEACGTERPMKNTPACKIATAEVMQVFQTINIYNIYDKCYIEKATLTEEDKLVQKRSFGGFKGRYPQTPYLHYAAQGISEDQILNINNSFSAGEISFLVDEPELQGNPPCADGVGSNWLFNDPQVQKALHVDKTEWSICNMAINITYRKDPKGSYYLYPKLINNNLRVWIYSGDVDCAVPYNGTQRWIQNLNLKPLKLYQSWSIDKEMVAGYRTVYTGLTLVTIKGAGHMVPTDKPAEAYKLFTSFLKGQDIVN
jgi:carboxypeptidase C (cathepsin A)